MAVLAAAQLLDELMGRNRNVAPNEKIKELNWEDPEYCKYFLAKFCPHDLFVNTRADLGACPKVHDEEVRKLFQQTGATHHRKLQYQEDFLRFCVSMMNDVERKIVKGKQRLALNAKNEQPAVTSTQSQKNQEQINILNERINGLEAEAEQAGTDGNVEQAQGLMKLCDQLKEERDGLRRQIENYHWSTTAELAAQQEKQMEVCEVCGAFLIVGDAQQRIDDHLMGKQHMGFARLKAAVDEVSAEVKAAREEREFRRGGGLGSGGTGAGPDRERDRDRERRRERERERDRRLSREQERERRERERSRTVERIEKREREPTTTTTKDRERDREDRDGFRNREKKHRSDRESGHRHHHRHHHRH